MYKTIQRKIKRSLATKLNNEIYVTEFRDVRSSKVVSVWYVPATASYVVRFEKFIVRRNRYERQRVVVYSDARDLVPTTDKMVADIQTFIK